MSSKVFYFKTFPDSYRIDTYWVQTRFPNLLLLAKRDEWQEQSEIDYSEIESLVENDNEPPSWLKKITKNRNLVNPPEVSYTYVQLNPYEDGDLTDWTSESVDPDYVFPREEVEFLFDIQRRRLPETSNHSCDTHKYLTFVASIPYAFYVGLKDGIERSENQEFWDAVKVSDEVIFGPAEWDYWSDYSSEFGISNCSQCVPEIDEQFIADPVQAVNEVIHAESLDDVQTELIDSLLHRSFSEIDISQVETEVLEAVKDAVTELTQKYPSNFPQLEYWLAVN